MRTDSGGAEATRRVAGDLTSFVGRAQELGDIRRMLGTARLVTLTGLGGVGKTRLALRALHDVRRAFADNVFLIELASFSDPTLLSHMMLDTLAIPQDPTKPPQDVLVEFLGSRHALLVLDNCEHLVTSVADLVTRLLRSAPDLRILATSRQPLSIDGEQVYPVAPLPVPRSGFAGYGLDRIPSVMLFVDRAAVAVPGFRLDARNEIDVASICEQLEGIPLAIELAAARLSVLSTADLAARLGDRMRLLTRGSRTLPGRQRTLEAAIEGSYSLCSEVERKLWERASVFAGGFTLEAAEMVCTGVGVPPDDVLDAIAALKEKSILTSEEQGNRLRFRMLEVIREYGRARLDATGELEVYRRKHRDWCSDLLDRACAGWFGPHQADWASSLRDEHPNLRAALEYSLTVPDDHAIALTMAGRPWFWWIACGFATEGSLWLERVLAVSTEPTIDRAWALTTAAYVSLLRGDKQAGADYVTMGLTLAHSLQDPGVLAYLTDMRGFHSFVTGKIGAAIEQWQRAIELFDQSDARQDYPNGVRMQMAIAYLVADDAGAAMRIVADLRRRCEAAGEQWLLSYAMNADAFAMLERGELNDAERQLRPALRVKRSFNDDLGLAFVLDVLAWTSIAQGKDEFGQVLLGASSRLWGTLGEQLWGSALMLDRRRLYMDRARARVGSAAADAAFARGLAMELSDVLGYALDEPFAQTAEPTPQGALAALTPRERDVAQLIGKGYSNREVAADMVISVRTVGTHVEHILAKLGLTSRSQVAALLHPDSDAPDRAGRSGSQWEMGASTMSAKPGNIHRRQ